MRIVSLLPSATDIVCALGLREHLVGRTHECDWPPGVEQVPVMTRDVLGTGDMSSREIDRAVGGSMHSGSSIYALDHGALAAARPDLILTQELCAVCAVSYAEVSSAARLMEAGPRVLSLEPRTLPDVLATIRDVARVTGAEAEAARAVDEAHRRLGAVTAAVKDRRPPVVAAVEWLDPPYAAGHWVPDQVAAAGGREALGSAGRPSAPVPWEAVLAARPEVLVLLPCGLSPERARRELPALSSRPGYAGMPAVRQGRVWLVDGPAYFNRPGPRTVRGVEVLAHVLHGIGTVAPGEATRAA